MSAEQRAKISAAQMGNRNAAGAMRSAATRAKMLGNRNAARGPQPHRHKNDVSYAGIHMWVQKYRPRAGTCQECGAERTTHHANLSGEYRRDLDDYREMCVPCHKSYDLREGRLARETH